MTSYTITPGSDGATFNVVISGANGTRQTLLGFATKSEAEAWITNDKRLNHPDDGPTVFDSPTPAGD